MRELISNYLLSHILLRVLFYLWVSSIWELTLWICILRESISDRRSLIAFLLISILILCNFQVYLCSFSVLSFSSRRSEYFDSMLATSSFSLRKSCSRSLSSKSYFLREVITASLCADSVWSSIPVPERFLYIFFFDVF